MNRLLPRLAWTLAGTVTLIVGVSLTAVASRPGDQSLAAIIGGGALGLFSALVFNRDRS